jgi:mRNA interferase RelE/StbE
LGWRVEFLPDALKQLSKLDKPVARRIVDYLESRVAESADPRSVGKGLTGNRSGKWRYRVGDYRVLCRIEDGRLLVLVLEVGHRSTVYGG